MPEDEGLSEAVKRLFMMIREGRAVLSEDVPELRAAMAAVRFSEDGEPVMDTVTPLVRAAACGVAATESGVDTEVPPEWEERFSALESVLPDRVPVDEGILEEAAASGDHRTLAFNLYKEATGLALLGRPFLLRLSQVHAASFWQWSSTAFSRLRNAARSWASAGRCSGMRVAKPERRTRE